MWIVKLFSFDLDFDLMTLVLRLDLDIVIIYMCTENEVPGSSSSKVIAWTNKQIDRHTVKLNWNYYLSTHADGS